MSRPLLLVVDDARDIVRIVEHLGRLAGQDVASCADAPAAWAYLSQVTGDKLQVTSKTEEGPVLPGSCNLSPGSWRRPDLVVLDVSLPGPSGLDLFRRMQEVPELAAVPVALFTQWSMPERIAAGLEAGIDFVLAKDLLGRPDAWKERVEEILTQADGRTAELPVDWGLSGPPALAPEGQAALRQALRHPALGRLGADVVRALLRRTPQRALARLPGGARPAPGAEAADWLTPDGLALHPARLAACPAFAAAFALELARQLDRLLGATASRPIRSALVAAVPELVRPDSP
jgi:CheY-like chemotaxis protein